MWSVFLFARKGFCTCLCAQLCIGLICFWGVLIVPGRALAAEGRASFAALLAGGLSPVGLGGYHSTPARYAIPSYGVSYYWLDDVDETSWNLSLEFGNDAYRVGTFVAYESMDSLYRNLYSEVSYAKTWLHFALGMSYGLGIEWNPGEVLWTRHRFKWAGSFIWHQVYLAGMLSGFTDEGVSPAVGVHWISDEAVSAFAEFDFDYLYVGASFRWKFVELSSSYRFPDFAVALGISFSGSHYGASYARGFKHNSIGWNCVQVSRWLKK